MKERRRRWAPGLDIEGNGNGDEDEQECVVSEEEAELAQRTCLT